MDDEGRKERREIGDAEILARYSSDQQREIIEKQRTLSSLATFIGKDFRIPVELNEPGAGWHWDFKNNKIRIDPNDLLEKPMDYLRFVISHEGGHRRISRLEQILPEVWGQPGFSFLVNAVEDPRTNNFVADAYPKFKEQMALAYDQNLMVEKKATDIAQKKLGRQPRFMQAGFEYIKQWYKEVQVEPPVIDETLDEDIRKVVSETLVAAQDAWWCYPSKAEANKGEELIIPYAKNAYEKIRSDIWPKFQKLVDEDVKDQVKEEAKKQLEAEATEQQIKDYLDSLPEEARKELEAQARRLIQEVEAEIDKLLQGALMTEPTVSLPSEPVITEPKPEVPKPKTSPDIQRYKDFIERALQQDDSVYDKNRREMLPVINKLENDLREIFMARRDRKWKSGYKTGKRIDIKRRIQEKGKGIPAIESKAWQKRELPAEKDYAITLLVDLSGSMDGEKIRETFKAVVVVAEVLNKLSIKTEILGFHDQLLVYQQFGELMSKKLRANIGNMPQEVHSAGARYNDDGWALEQASERLRKQQAGEQFLIVFSDGIPEESPDHPRKKYDLHEVISTVTEKTRQKLVGLGIGSGTQHVERYYPNSLANVDVHEMADKLADLIREVISESNSFV